MSANDPYSRHVWQAERESPEKERAAYADGATAHRRDRVRVLSTGATGYVIGVEPTRDRATVRLDSGGVRKYRLGALERERSESGF